MGSDGDGRSVPLVTVKLFAWLRDQYGQKEIQIPSAEVPVMARLLERLNDLAPAGQGILSETGVLHEGFVVLLNGRGLDFAGGMDAALEDGDEVAVFPPVAGG